MSNPKPIADDAGIEWVCPDCVAKLNDGEKGKVR